MYCRNCGNQLLDNAKFCSICGAEQRQVKESTENYVEIEENLTQKRTNDSYVVEMRAKKICCPNCHGKKLQATTETNTEVKTSGSGYSATKGCFGWLLFGPFGLLCGNCGNSQKTSVNTTNTTYWICSDCGYKFRNVDEWMRELDAKKEKITKAAWQVGIGCTIGIPLFIFLKMSFVMWFCIICVILSAILYPMNLNLINKEKEECRKLEYETTEK